MQFCKKGNYFFHPKPNAPFPNGVKSARNYEIVHATFFSPLPWSAGLDAAAKYVKSQNLPVESICAIELRCPVPFTPAGFGEFNKHYLSKLGEMGVLIDGSTGNSSMARSNVAPQLNPPSEPSLYAFSFTRPSSSTNNNINNYVMSGLVNSGGNDIISKTKQVYSSLTSLMKEMEVDAPKATHVNIYSAENIPTAVMAELQQVTSVHGLHWHNALPPVVGIDFEIDIRCVNSEVTIFNSNL